MIDYREVRNRAKKDYKQAVGKGENPFLPALDEILEEHTLYREVPLGEMEIPVHMIRGTKAIDRKAAFSRNFLPLLAKGSEFSAKWVNLYEVQMESGFIDPVKLYEYMNEFYVLEGNKRVSIMKFLNGDSILANVTRIVPPLTDDLKVRIYYEFMQFYNVVGFYGIVFTKLGGYKKLAEAFGQDLVHPWPEETIQLMKNTFTYFGVILAGHGGSKLNITAADALLIYFDEYGRESLLQDIPKTVKRNMDRIWYKFNGHSKNVSRGRQIRKVAMGALRFKKGRRR